MISVAIDGPAGAGKSTLARRLAAELGYIYVDTGAIYRTVGYYMRLMGVGPKDKDGIARLIDEVNIDIRYEDGVQHMILNGVDVTGEIRTPEMSMYASGVSAQPCVRAFLLDMQRQPGPGGQALLQLLRITEAVVDLLRIQTGRLPAGDFRPVVRIDRGLGDVAACHMHVSVLVHATGRGAAVKSQVKACRLHASSPKSGTTAR